MRRLPNGSLANLSNRTGFPVQYLSDIIATRKRPSRKRAIFLEHASREMGQEISATMWLFGSKTDLRTAILGNRNN